MSPDQTPAPQTALSLPLPEIAADFMLRDDVAFLNHGSFGACPRPVFEVYQQWQRKLEEQPVDFLGRQIRDLLAQARERLGQFVGTAGQNLVFVPNVTHGINFVAHSLKLGAGDEVLSPNQEYGAVEGIWEFVCGKRGASYVRQPIPLPVSDPEAVVAQIWAGVTERTKVISLSHITSPTALIWPVAQICQKARAAGILTVIDGAHAVGQLDLDLEALGVDYYAGNCHKWLSSPKGAGFLYAHPDHQTVLEPLVVNWGWKNRHEQTSPLIDYYTWLGTDDPASYLAVPAAIDYQLERDWGRVRLACHALAGQIRAEIQALSGLPHICPDSTDWWMQMCAVPLPPNTPENAAQRLWEEFKVEVPIGLRVENRMYARISIQAYNTPEHTDRLLRGLKALLEG